MPAAAVVEEQPQAVEVGDGLVLVVDGLKARDDSHALVERPLVDQRVLRLVTQIAHVVDVLSLVDHVGARAVGSMSLSCNGLAVQLDAIFPLGLACNLPLAAAAGGAALADAVAAQPLIIAPLRLCR